MSAAESRYAKTLGVVRLEAARAELPFAGDLSGRPGFLHGGAIAGLLSVVCDDVLTAEGRSFQALTSTLEYLRGGREVTVQAHAKIVHFGSAVVTVEAIAWQDSSAKPIATMIRKYRRC